MWEMISRAWTDPDQAIILWRITVPSITVLAISLGWLWRATGKRT